MPEGLVRSLGALAAVTLVRGSVAFAVVFLAMLAARSARAEARHAVWLSAFVGFLLIPLAWVALPGIPLGPWLPRIPFSDLGAAAAPVLSRTEYAHLVERTIVDTSRAMQPGRMPTAALLAVALGAWAGGALLLAARVAAGTARIRRVAAEAVFHRGLQSTAERIAADLGLKKGFRVLLSGRCNIPFTLGLRRALVILPHDAPGWGRRLREAVLAHELSHVRRRDVLAHSFAYGVCLLLWFFPPAWFAYAALLREAEASCDQKVIDRGVPVRSYAHGILDLVRGSAGRMLLPAMMTALATPQMIKERVRSVLALKPCRRPFLPWHAAGIAAAFLCCLVPLLAVSGFPRGAGLRPDDPFFGTWVDEECDSLPVYTLSRVVVSPDGQELGYRQPGDSTPCSECWNSIEQTWIEAGAHWYRNRWVRWALPGRAGRVESYSLIRISADHATRESVSAQYGYPDSLSSLGPCYVIMHRQQ